jgi:hypothetical protein
MRGAAAIHLFSVKMGDSVHWRGHLGLVIEPARPGWPGYPWITVRGRPRRWSSRGAPRGRLRLLQPKFVSTDVGVVSTAALWAVLQLLEGVGIPGYDCVAARGRGICGCPPGGASGSTLRRDGSAAGGRRQRSKTGQSIGSAHDLRPICNIQLLHDPANMNFHGAFA